MYAERYLGFNPTLSQRQEKDSTSRMQLSWIKVLICGCKLMEYCLLKTRKISDDKTDTRREADET